MEEHIRFVKCENIQSDYLAPSREIGFFVGGRNVIDIP